MKWFSVYLDGKLLGSIESRSRAGAFTRAYSMWPQCKGGWVEVYERG